MRKCILLLGLVIGLLAILLALPPRDGEIWAVLVAGSPRFKNYAMQADICRAYQILIKGKVKKDHVIVFMPDDVAHDPMNFKPRCIVSSLQGPDVYRGISKDYTGKNLSLRNFLAVLAGNKSMITGGSGKVLATQANDRIFLFYAGHGYPGFVQFGDQILESEALLEALQQNYDNKKYKSMVMYFASCHSGSMFVQHDEAYKMINVYAIASSNAQQPSHRI